MKSLTNKFNKTKLYKKTYFKPSNTLHDEKPEFICCRKKPETTKVTLETIKQAYNKLSAQNYIKNFRNVIPTNSFERK
jgi:hypothetical protein